MATVLRLADDPVAYRRHSDAAQAHAQRHFSHETHRRRLHALIGPPSAPRPAAAPLRPLRVLLVSSNGVGMGHLTRLLAIARRLPPPIEPVFVTMSQAHARGRGPSATSPSTCRTTSIWAATSGAGTGSWPRSCAS